MPALRRGLPRVVGGEPWPPAGVAFAGAVAATAVPAAAASDGAPQVDGMPTAAAQVAAVETPVVVTSVAAAPAVVAGGIALDPSVAAPASAGVTPRPGGVPRRGLPRTPGGEPWPPADATIAFAVPPLAGATPSERRGDSASQEGIATAAPSSAPAPAARQGSAGGAALRRGLPHVVGGEPWPPADVRPAFEIPAVAALAAPPAAAPTPGGPFAPAEADTAGGGLPEGEMPPAIAAPPGPARPIGTTAGRPTRPAPAPRAVAPRPPARFTGAQVFGTLTAIVGGGFALLVIAAVVVLGVRMLLFSSAAGGAFLARFPGETALPDWAPVGQPLWAQWQHWLNAFFMILVIRTGWTVRTTRRPVAMWQRRSGKGKRMSIELWSHLALDVLWLANGVIFWVLLFATGQWVRVVPTSWEIFPNALSAGLQYLSLSWPTEDGWVNYNSLQVLTYFLTIFVAAPLAAVTGFRMSPLWPAKAQRLSKAYPMELARAIHFPVMLYFVAFVIVHVVLVLATGALRNLNHMFWGTDDAGSWVGFWVFLLGAAVIVAGAIAARPAVLKYVGGAFGKVGR